MANYGVIDLGSNTIRLCVYQVSEEKKNGKPFRSLLNNRVVAGLSAYVIDGNFSEQGIERASQVLKGHSKRLRYFDCERTDVFATAVIRNCKNSKAVIQELEERSGFSIALLSEKEEAHLGFVGASCEQSIVRGTLIDIGGGSTELTAIAKSHDTSVASIAQGSLSSFTDHVSLVIPTPNEMSTIAAHFEKSLEKTPDLKRYRTKEMFGIGGSLRAAAKVFTTLFAQNEPLTSFTPGQFQEFFDLCRTDPNMIARVILKTVPERVHTLIPGCLIADQAMKTCRAETLTLRKKGVREGYLIERILMSKKQQIF